jgi:S1-C subfamily serine protease
VLVYTVDPGGPAARAGIKPGDLIAAVDGKPTPDPAVLAVVLAQLSPGQTVKVKVIHPDGSTAEVDLTLGELPG